MRFPLVKTLAVSCSVAAAMVCGGDTAEKVESKLKEFQERPFPKIFLPEGWKNRLAENRATAQGRLLENYIFFHAAEMLKKEPVRRRVIGFRMLDVAREVLFRINTLSFAWLLSGEQSYAE